MNVSVSVRDVEQTVALAHEAGQAILEVYRTEFTVENKDDRSPVTAADRRAEAVIAAGLRAFAPTIAMVGEEAFAEGRAPAIEHQSSFWLVDPLDGTKEFVKRNGEFTVNIALIADGRPVLGVVHAPALPATYWGSRHGAYAEAGGQSERPIQARHAPSDGLVALVSRSHPSPETDAYLKPLRIRREISAGSSLKFCLLAAGQADVYPRFGRTMEWDTAAGHAVLRFAGGHVRDLAGGELHYGKPGFENPPFVASGADPVDVL